MDRRRALRALAGIGLTSGLSAWQVGCSSSASGRRALPGPDWPGLPRLERPTRRRFTAIRGKLEAPAGVASRREWSTERTIASRADRMVRVERITVHHDGMPPVSLASRAAVRDRLAMIRRSHVGRGWADIGYHFIVDPMGTAWEGRPLVWQGAHVRDHNPRNLGIMVLGNFEVQSPTPDAMDALDELISSLMVAHNVPLRNVRTHREYASTACPGRNLQRHMDDTRADGLLSDVTSFG